MRDVFTTGLRYKLWFDLWGARQRTIQAVLTIAIGAFAVGTVLGTLRGVNADTQRTWSTVAAPAITLRVTPPASDELIETLARRPDLSGAEGQMEAAIEWRPAPDAPWSAATLIARDDYADQRLSLLLLEAGAWPAGRSLAVERRFAAGLGDQVELRLDDHAFSAAVGGVVYNRAAPPASLGGDIIFYTTRARFAELSGQDRFQLIQAGVPDYTPALAAAAAERLRADLADQGYTAIPAAFNRGATYDPEQAWFEDLIAGAGFVMQVIAVVAMALSLLLIYTTVTAIITHQTAQIGELKAIGASGGQIVAVYTLLVGAYGALAAAISLPAAYGAANVLRRALVTQFGMTPGPLQFDRGVLLLQLALCIVAPLLIALLPIGRGARVTVREAISSYGLSSTGSGLDTLLDSLVWLSRVVSLAISNAFRNWSRLLLTQLALGGAGVTVVAVLSTQATLGYSSGGLMTSIYPYQVQLDLEQPASMARLAQVAEEPTVAGVEGWRTLSAVLEPDGGAARTIQVNGVPLPSDAYRPRLSEGRWLEPGDTRALALAESVARELGVRAGDHVTLRIPAAGGDAIWASEERWEVVGIVLDPRIRNLNRMALAPRATLIDEAGGGQRLNRVQIAVPTAAGPQAPAAAGELRRFYEARGLQVKITRDDTVYQRGASQARNLNVLTILLLVMAAIVAAVGGIALSGVLQISVLERRREIGVLRAIGADPATVRSLFVIEGLILGWLSWLVALAFSYPVGLALSAALTATIGISFVFQYAWGALGLWLALASAIGVLASLAPAQRAISASVQESLAYE